MCYFQICVLHHQYLDQILVLMLVLGSQITSVLKILVFVLMEYVNQLVKTATGACVILATERQAQMDVLVSFN